MENEIVKLVTSKTFVDCENSMVELNQYKHLHLYKKQLFFNINILKSIKHSDQPLEFIQYEEPGEYEFLNSRPSLRKVEIHEVVGGAYDYLDATENEKVGMYSCYVNFADSKLFGHWYKSYFAQDEIQAAEHPDLVRIAVELNYPNCWQKPCLISNAMRSSKADLKKIYGWEFCNNSFEEVSKHVSQLNPMTKTNILAMVAVNVSRSKSGQKYNREDIITLFKTAYTAFRMVVLEKKTKNTFKKVIVNTGNWGGGAFDNNQTLIAVLQILAAHVSGVDELNYFTFDEKGSVAFNRATDWVNKNIKSYQNIEDWIQRIYGECFVYGTSNNT